MPNWKKVIVSGSDASLNSLIVTNGVTGSLQGTASWANNATTSSRALQANTASYALFAATATSASFAQTSSFINTLNQSVIITNILAIGTSSIGSTESTLIVGTLSTNNTGEGGQILLAASGGLYTSASMLDIYQNRFRILRGTNASSDAEFFNVNLHNGQVVLNKYSGSGAFTGTVAANLAVDSGGNIITTVPGAVTSASFATTASYAFSASAADNATSASRALQANTASYIQLAASASYALSASYAQTASYADNFTVRNFLYVDSASLDYQQNLAVATGSFQTIVSVATGSYRCAFFDYVAYSGSTVRAGTLVSTWSGSVTEYYENYTADLGGSTSVVTLQTAISASNIVLQAGISGSAWSVRSLVRLL